MDVDVRIVLRRLEVIAQSILTRLQLLDLQTCLTLYAQRAC